MRRSTTVVLAATVAIVGAMLAMPSPSLASDDNGIPLNAQVAWRDANGMRSDMPYVRSLQTVGDAAAVAAKYGAVFTSEEQTELDRRRSLQDRVPAIGEGFARSNPDSYAGLYIEPKTGTLVVMGLSGTAEMASQARQDLGAGNPVRTANATYTLAKLQAVDTDLGRATSWLNDRGAWAFGVDVVGNAVEVDYDSARTTSEQLAAALASRFGGTEAAMLQLQARTPASTASCGGCDTDGLPYKGGQQIINQTQGLVCTAGFGVHRTVTNPFPQPATTTYYMLTAGHCGANNDIFQHYIYIMGPMQQSRISGYSDSGVINIQPQTAHSNLVFANGSSQAITTSTASNGYPVGSTYCYFGQTSGFYKCATVNNGGMTATACNEQNVCGTVQDVVRTNNPPLGGDSGGCGFITGRAQGITWATDGTNGYFVKIYHALREQGVALN